MIIKRTSKYSLYQGSLQANGLYNLTEKKTGKITHWFNVEETEILMKASNKEFNRLAKKHIYYE